MLIIFDYNRLVGKRGVVMEALVISPDFTIEDIHKIREQNYERTKDMTIEEKITYYNNSGRDAEREIERLRAVKRRIKGNI